MTTAASAAARSAAPSRWRRPSSYVSMRRVSNPRARPSRRAATPTPGRRSAARRPRAAARRRASSRSPSTARRPARPRPPTAASRCRRRRTRRAPPAAAHVRLEEGARRLRRRDRHPAELVGGAQRGAQIVEPGQPLERDALQLARHDARAASSEPSLPFLPSSRVRKTSAPDAAAHARGGAGERQPARASRAAEARGGARGGGESYSSQSRLEVAMGVCVAL